MPVYIIYDQSGQSQQVFDTALQGYLRRGYSINPPASQEVAGQALTSDNLSVLIEMTGNLDINTASIKNLQTLPDVAIALAKKIKAGRPYLDLTDLIQRVNEVPWLNLKDQICLSKPDTDASNTSIASDDEEQTETEPEKEAAPQ